MITMSEEIKLKPCPFCGGAVKIEKTPMLWVVHCAECQSITSFEPQSQMSVMAVAYAWNRRAEA